MYAIRRYYGQNTPPANGDYLDNFNPATGEVYGKIPDSGPSDVAAAVQAARNNVV